jgi:hypothetical protein
MIKSFTLGAIGSLISAVSIALIFIINFFTFVIPILATSDNFPYFYNVIIESFFPILIGVGILLASFGYREIKNRYGLLFGNVGFAFGVIASVFVFFTGVFGLITPYYILLLFPYPLLYSIYFSWVSLLNAVVFGLTYIVWGIAHFRSKGLCKKPKLGLVASGFFVASGVVILSIYYADVGLEISIASLLFASIVFLNQSPLHKS